MTPSTIDQIFDTLDKWKSFPAYQLERRADIFFAIYLKQILNHKFNTLINHILPEFPIQKNTIYRDGSNRSEKIDYVGISDNKVFFVELKTDLSSKRIHQDNYLRLAQEVNIPKLINGLIQMYDVTQNKYAKKYEALFDELIEVGWMNQGYENLSSEYDIKVVYIQPILKKGEGSQSVITFNDVIDSIEDKEDQITKRFILSLRKWEQEAMKTNYIASSK